MHFKSTLFNAIEQPLSAEHRASNLPTACSESTLCLQLHMLLSLGLSQSLTQGSSQGLHTRPYDRAIKMASSQTPDPPAMPHSQRLTRAENNGAANWALVCVLQRWCIRSSKTCPPAPGPAGG